ncbi:MAG: DUF2891 family protein [Polyangiaceae bacterium]
MQSLAERLADMALEVIRTETPHCYDFHGPTPRPLDKGAPLTPKNIHPAFYGCFDWHSAVHSHWLLVELLRRRGTSPRFRLDRDRVDRITELLTTALSAENCQMEHDFLVEHPRFERPYGWAWALGLCASLGRTAGLEAAYAAMKPIERVCAGNLSMWLESLPYPTRGGEHGQSAFSLSLFMDWARDAESLRERYRTGARETALRLYGRDHSAALRFEPSANDFLSPALGAAFVLSRALDTDAFADFCSRYFDSEEQLRPTRCPDPSDGKLAHLIGLNLSRAWMLFGIAKRLPASALRDTLLDNARAHRQVGLAQCACEDLIEADQAPQRSLTERLHFMVSHWIGSFVLLMEDEAGSPLA